MNGASAGWRVKECSPLCELSKLSRKDVKGWFCSFRVGRGADDQIVRKCCWDFVILVDSLEKPKEQIILKLILKKGGLGWS
jgi:hypothetical protein